MSPANLEARRPATARRAVVRGGSLSDARLRYLFCAAILLRVVMFLFIGVSNGDDHLEVVRYAAENRALPHIDQFNQAYHPPLYYIIAATVLTLSGSVKVVQSVSLLFSIVALALAWYLVDRLTGLSAEARFWALMLVSLHPQFVMYTMFISNDPLAILLGLTILALAYRYSRHPATGNAVLLATALGLGLATKFTFLAFMPPILVVLYVVSRRRGMTLRRTLATVATMLLIVVALGSYKFVDTARVVGNPLASNLDISPWAEAHKPTWTGPMTLLDVNLLKLVRRPIVSEETVHSYPLMLYGSFWYQFFPDSTFRSNTKAGLNLLGSLIYVLALVPTAMMLIGLGSILTNSTRWLWTGRAAWRTADAQRTLQLLAVSLLCCNVALLAAVGWKHDVYSVFNSRLLLPSYFGFLVCLAAGIHWAARVSQRLSEVNGVMLRLLHGAFVVYVALDVCIAIARPVDPLITHHVPYTINMTAGGR